MQQHPFTGQQRSDQALDLTWETGEIEAWQDEM